LRTRFASVKREDGYLRVYDVDDTASLVNLCMENGFVISEIRKNKIGLEEYYVELMSRKEEK